MQEKVTKFSGLLNQRNPLNVGPGALVTANDCSIRRENVIEDRRGYKLYGTLSNNAAQLLTYSNRVLVHNGSALSYDNGSGTFADYSGSYSAPTGRKMRFVEAASNLFTTTSAGVKVFSDVAGTAGRLAGAPRALNSSYSLAGSSGFLADGSQTAYRTLIVRADANGNTLRGYPSQRLWVVNGSGGSRNVALTVYLASEVATGDAIEVYRTESTTGTTDDTAGDEMGLVYQYTLTSSDISTGSVTFTDSVTDALRGAALYISPSQEGIAQANDRPPVCKDMCLYKTFMLYANTKTKQRLLATLVGTTALGRKTTGDTTNGSNSVINVASTSNIAVGWKVEGTGIPANTTVTAVGATTVTLSANATATNTGVTLNFYTNQTITLSGMTFKFGSSEITTGAGSPQVKVYTTGVAASDIDSTARSFEYVVNKYTSNSTIYAYYTSGPEDTPGKMMFEERGLGASAFTIQSSDTNVQAMFYPYPPVSPATNTASMSTQDVRLNAVYIAKSQEYEHVPALNYKPVGPANKEVLRVVALRDSAIVIKEEGVYRITGETFSGMTVAPIDLTVRCKAPDSVAVLDNQVFMLSNQGVVLISESGVQIISHEIGQSVLPILLNSNLSSYTFGAGYESERSYYLSTITSSDDTSANQTLVFNIDTRAWVRHTYAFISAIVEDSADKLFFVKNSSVNVYQERKDFQNSDYADPDLSATIISVSGTSITFTLTTDTPEDGWVISQGGTEIALSNVNSLGSNNYSAILLSDAPSDWAAGAATIYPSVGMDVVFHAFTGQGNPDLLKQVSLVGVFTDDTPGYNTMSLLSASFKTNFDAETEEVDITEPAQGWGAAWSTTPWGGSGNSNGYPTYVPRNKQYCTRMNVGVKHKNARERISISGIGYVYEVASERIGR